MKRSFSEFSHNLPDRPARGDCFAYAANARTIWERPTSIAWGFDDRMWTLIYWPEQSVENRKPTTLTGWSLPQTGAAIDDPVRRARLMLAWDKSSPWLQAISRAQVNPNHVLYELNGIPIFADGKTGRKRLMELCRQLTGQ